MLRLAGGMINQSDGTSWMAFYSLDLEHRSIEASKITFFDLPGYGPKI